MLDRGKVQLIETMATLKEQHAQAKLEDIFLQLTQEYRESNGE